MRAGSDLDPPAFCFEMMYNTNRLKEKKDIKLFILYLLCHLKCPVEYNTAHDLAVQDGVITPLDFSECFSELLDAETIAEHVRPDGESEFYVTQRGEHVVVTLQDSLSSSLRERCLRNAMRFLSFRRRGAKLEHSIVRREDGFYTLTCSIREDAGILLEMTVSVPTRQQAERMAFHFADSPEETYRAVIASMKGDSILL